MAKHDIFVSYRSTDRELVAQVVRKLEARGIGVWYDVEMQGGTDWTDDIVAALQDADMLVVFFSEACNASKHLKRELLIADKMSKSVVPILIEDTEPRGGYLYLLADRNWIKAFPNAETRIDEMVELLTVLSKKAGGLSGEVGAEPAKQEAASATEDSVSKGSAPRKKEAYVGKDSALGKSGKPLRNILPFRWIDLIVLVPGVAGILWWMSSSLKLENQTEMVVALSMFGLAALGFYGAMVFPIRYYLRRLTLGAASLFQFVSISILLGLLLGIVWVAKTVFNMFPYDQPLDVLVVYGVVFTLTSVLVYGLTAFVLWGILAAKRALNSFRGNLKELGETSALRKSG
jgi:hypothetical protein